MVNVLIVEGCEFVEDVRRIISDVQSDYRIPIDVRTFLTADDARQYISWAEVAIVSDDLNGGLPDASGYEFINQLKGKNPDATAVIYGNRPKRFVPENCRFDFFVESLSDPQEIIEIVKQYHERRKTVGNPSD